jgi:hypothetical protein
MVRLTSVVLSCCLLVAAGCRHPEPTPPAGFISGNDFEGLDGWVPVGPAVTAEQAHTGRYSTKVDSGTEYSLSYTNTLGKIGLGPGQTLKVTGWGFLTGGQANASVVVQVVNPANEQEKVFWEALPLVEQVKIYHRWSPIKRSFRMPDNIKPEYQLRVYLWRQQATQPAYLDDIILAKAD